MRTGYVYGLRDPETNELRYVGKTLALPEQRRDGHVLGAANGSTQRVSAWIRTLAVEPVVTVFEADVPEEVLEEVERRYIRSMLSAGHRLLNSAGVSHA